MDNEASTKPEGSEAWRSKLTSLQQDVHNRAARILTPEPWFPSTGVCINDFPSDADIKHRGISACVAEVVERTRGSK